MRVMLFLSVRALFYFLGRRSFFFKYSLDGWTVMDVTSLDVNSNNVRVSHPPSLPAGEFVYFSAPEKYLGTQIYSYGRSFIISMKLDTGSVSQPEAAFLKITGGTISQVITYIGHTITPTDQISTFKALLYEDLWLLEGELRSPLSSEFYGEFVCINHSQSDVLNLKRRV